MPTLENGINLAYWLAKVHPEIYARILPMAVKATRSLGALGDDITSGDTGITTTFDTSDVVSPDLTALPAPDLTNVSIDAATGFTTPSFSAGASAVIGSSAQESGGFLTSIGSGLADVGKWLTSAVGLSSVSNVATAVVKANTPQSQTIQTQLARVASGTNPAPITYGLNTAGQLIPILQPAQTAGMGLTSQTLAKLLPSSLQPYVIPIGIGIIALVLLGSRRGKR